MESGGSFEVIIRKTHGTPSEDYYRITVMKKLESLDELLLHPEIMSIVGNGVVRVEKIDNFRFRVSVEKAS